jgi:hypothetical protein
LRLPHTEYNRKQCGDTELQRLEKNSTLHI